MVNAANELLSDPDKRARFDRGEIDAAGDPTAPEPPRYRRDADAAEGARYRAGPDDDHPSGNIFGDFLNRGAGGGEALRLRGTDARYALAVDFLDTVTGATRTLTLPDGLSEQVVTRVEKGDAVPAAGRVRGLLDSLQRLVERHIPSNEIAPAEPAGSGSTRCC